MLAASVALSLILSACGGKVILEQSSGGGGAGGSGSATGGPLMTSATGGANGGAGSGVHATCMGYCSTIMGNCTKETEQYANTMSCMNVCNTFPPGRDGDTTGNSLACRMYHANEAKLSPATHCGAAGPTGGDTTPSDTSPGSCGDGCEALCKLTLGVCTGKNEVFKDMADCQAQCKTLKSIGFPYSLDVAHNGGYYCRVYAATKAATGPDYASVCSEVKFGPGAPCGP
jgi:hypothetical protein